MLVVDRAAHRAVQALDEVAVLGDVLVARVVAAVDEVRRRRDERRVDLARASPSSRLRNGSAAQIASTATGVSGNGASRT
jgi:hypothetical protein